MHTWCYLSGGLVGSFQARCPHGSPRGAVTCRLRTVPPGSIF